MGKIDPTTGEGITWRYVVPGPKPLPKSQRGAKCRKCGRLRAASAGALCPACFATPVQLALPLVGGNIIPPGTPGSSHSAQEAAQRRRDAMRRNANNW